MLQGILESRVVQNHPMVNWNLNSNLPLRVMANWTFDLPWLYIGANWTPDLPWLYIRANWTPDLPQIYDYGKKDLTCSRGIEEISFFVFVVSQRIQFYFMFSVSTSA